MRVLKYLTSVFLGFALLSWGIYFASSYIPVPYRRLVILCKLDKELAQIREQYGEYIVNSEEKEIYERVYQKGYILYAISDNREFLEGTRDAIVEFLRRKKRKVALEVSKLPTGEYILVLKKVFPNKKAAERVQKFIYDRGRGYRLDISKRFKHIKTKATQVTIEIPSDKYPKFVEFLESGKFKTVEVIENEEFLKRE